MRVLMTGTSGLIGSAVRSALSDLQIHALGRRAELADTVVDLHACQDLAALRLPAVDALVHCAGVTDEEIRADPGAALERATLGTEALLKVAGEAGARKFIYVSSTHVYGAQAGEIRESSPPDPQSLYALAHYCTEQLFKRFAAASGGLSCVLRPNAVYGPLAHPERFKRWTLIPFSFPLEAKRTGSITLKSTGVQRRNFVSAAAVAEVAGRWLRGELPPDAGVINVVGDVCESVLEFAQRCAGLCAEVSGRACVVNRPQEAAAGSGREAGQDFVLLSRFPQPRPGGELNAFIRDLLKQC